MIPSPFVTAVMVVTHGVSAAGETGKPAGGGGTGANPLNGVTPDTSAFGAEFNSVWVKIIAAVWAICLGLAVMYTMRGAVAWASHRGSAHPQQMHEAKSSVVNGLWGLGALIGLPIIIAALRALLGVGGNG